MIEWMVEVEYVDIARPVDDMKKMKSPHSCVQRGQSDGGRSREIKGSGYEVMGSERL